MKKFLFKVVLGVTLLCPISTLQASSIQIEETSFKCLSMDNVKDKVTIKYPRPVDKVIYLRSENGFEYQSSAILTTLNGSVVAQLFASRFKDQLSFDLSEVPNGTYLLLMNSVDITTEIEVVVQH